LTWSIFKNVTSSSDFFPVDRVAILAHRGLSHLAGVTENSLDAFRAAVDAGADVIECDVRATRDNIAVFAHDETLERVFGNPAHVRSMTYRELRALLEDSGFPAGAGIISVEDALAALPQARFNIDVKESAVIEPLARAIADTQASERVLITSFSGTRRRRTLALLAQLGGKQAATSGSADTVAGVVVLCFAGLPTVARWWAREVRILQIPERVLGIATSSERMMRRFHQAGFLVQFWTINDVENAQNLAINGCDGLVTDRSDLLVEYFRRPDRPQRR
jgi:glycerophosphoryl diester phosphodiesterase